MSVSVYVYLSFILHEGKVDIFVTNITAGGEVGLKWRSETVTG